MGKKVSEWCFTAVPVRDSRLLLVAGAFLMIVQSSIGNGLHNASGHQFLCRTLATGCLCVLWFVGPQMHVLLWGDGVFSILSVVEDSLPDWLHRRAEGLLIARVYKFSHGENNPDTLKAEDWHIITPEWGRRIANVLLSANGICHFDACR